MLLAVHAEMSDSLLQLAILLLADIADFKAIRFDDFMVWISLFVRNKAVLTDSFIAVGAKRIGFYVPVTFLHRTGKSALLLVDFAEISVDGY